MMEKLHDLLADYDHNYESDNDMATGGGDHDDDDNTGNLHGNHDSQGGSRGGNSDSSHDYDDDCQEDEPSGAAIASTGMRVA